MPPRQLEPAHRAEVSAGGKRRTQQHNRDENTRRIFVFRAVLTRSTLTDAGFSPHAAADAGAATLITSSSSAVPAEDKSVTALVAV